MAHEYISPAEFKETKELRGLNYADLDIDLALEAASRAIDELADRRFWLDATNTVARYYSPRRPDLLWIDDIVDVQSVKCDRDSDGTFEETWTVNVDFYMEPLNAAADGKPYERIRANLANSSYWLPSGRPRSISVTGQYGWAAVPAQVKQAASLLASRLMLRSRDAPLGVVAIGLDAAIRLARTDPDVMALVNDVRRDEPLAG